MTKTKLLLIIFISLITTSKSDASSFTVEKTYTETIGLDVNDTPLSGSDWIVDSTTAFAVGCEDFNSPAGYYYDSKPAMRGAELLRSETVGDVVEYISKTTSNCSSVVNALDPLHRAIWNDMGLIQKPEFGVTTKTCGPGYSCGDVSLYQVNQTIRVDNLTGTEGTNGSTANDIDVFVYNYGNLSANVTNGIPGVGGLSDITQGPNQIKYCYQIIDANSEGVNSEFALRPIYNLKIYNWNAFHQGANQKSGSLNGETSGKAYIYKGLDSSMRKWISSDIYPGI